MSDLANILTSSKSTAFPLLALARKYEIDTLSTLIYNNITNNIQRATVLHVLKVRFFSF
jgi:hypothetical protein